MGYRTEQLDKPFKRFSSLPCLFLAHRMSTHDAAAATTTTSSVGAIEIVAAAAVGATSAVDATTTTIVRMAPTATFSTLPLGPLGTVVLYLTVAGMAQLIGTNKEMNTSALDSPEFWRQRCCGTFGRHVDYIEVRSHRLII